ncbi:hypothetical protein [Rhodopirellula baltica]|uniref:hypothetical protein n=1 Tax=Rhodopirellula baltica TaxID=265606 RepID=UPI00055CBB2E|nr:hypothetical protein [Rhodopirellula baltica]
MRTKLFLAVAVVATSSLFLQTTDIQAQGRRHCGQGVGNYGQASQYYTYPASRAVVHSNNIYGARAYYPSVGYSSGYGSYNGYNYPNQIRYSSGYGYRGGNSYRSGYGFPSNGGLSIGIGVGGFGNRGFGY